MKYQRLRIGKPILLKWRVYTGGEALPLEGRNISFFLVNAVGVRLPMKFTTDSNILIAYFYGPDQKSLGKYGVELWEDKGLSTQNVVDQRIGFELVAHTDEEEIVEDANLQLTTEVELNTALLDVIGKSGGGTYDDTELREMIRDLERDKLDKTEAQRLYHPYGAVPTNLSDLHEDIEHQTVSAEEKAKWNAGSGGESYNDKELRDKITNLEANKLDKSVYDKDKLGFATKEDIPSTEDFASAADLANKADKLKKVTPMSLDVTLEANTYNEWSLPLSGVLNIRNENFIGENDEYVIKFSVGGDLKVLINKNVMWFGGHAPKIEVGKTYVISIVNNLAVGGEFANETV